MQITRRTATKGLLATATGGFFSLAKAHAAGSAASAAAVERLRTQVCVIGGGSAGTGAALAAARAGAKVVLLESESILGGTSTNAWVHTWEPTSGADGIPRDVYNEMRKDPLGVTYDDYSRGAPRRGGHGLPFEPRAFNYVVRDMLDSTDSCTTLLATTFFGAQIDGARVKAVEAWFAITDHAVDIHGRKGRLYEVPNGPYGVPYRCLQPRGVENLMIASRAASFSHIAASSCRLCRTMMTLGQAAGTAAALAVAQHTRPRDVDVAKLQATLRAGGVALST